MSSYPNLHYRWNLFLYCNEDKKQKETDEQEKNRGGQDVPLSGIVLRPQPYRSQTLIN